MGITRMFALLCLVATSVLSSGDVSACMVPHSGPEYDAELSIVPLDGSKNAFRISAPLRMNGSGVMGSALKWWLRESPTDGNQPYRDIVLKVVADRLVGEFIAPSQDEAYDVTVEIWYGPETGGCPTIAEVMLDEMLP